MPRDGQIDYSSYTQAQLEDALTRIDPAAYPMNHQSLVAELQRRATAPMARSTPARGSGELTLGHVSPVTAPTIMLPSAWLRLAASPGARLSVKIGLAALAVAGLAGVMLSDLLPSPTAWSFYRRSGLVIAVIAFLALLSKTGPFYDVGDPAFVRRLERHRWLRNDLVRAIVGATVGFMIGVVAAQGVAWTYTVARGRPATQTFVAWSWYEGRLLRCARPRLEGVWGAPPRALCSDTVGPVGARVEITGARTVFGIRAQRMRVAESTP
jgi:hypothetical protein